MVAKFPLFWGPPKLDIIHNGSSIIEFEMGFRFISFPLCHSSLICSSSWMKRSLSMCLGTSVPRTLML